MPEPFAPTITTDEASVSRIGSYAGGTGGRSKVPICLLSQSVKTRCPSTTGYLTKHSACRRQKAYASPRFSSSFTVAYPKAAPSAARLPLVGSRIARGGRRKRRGLFVCAQLGAFRARSEASRQRATNWCAIIFELCFARIIVERGRRRTRSGARRRPACFALVCYVLRGAPPRRPQMTLQRRG